MRADRSLYPLYAVDLSACQVVVDVEAPRIERPGAASNARQDVVRHPGATLGSPMQCNGYRHRGAGERRADES
ncbi:MAG: hypothetical protein V3T05_00935 [Myxococcota bacterium]